MPLLAAEIYFRSQEFRQDMNRNYEPYIGAGEMRFLVPQAKERAGYHPSGLPYTYSPDRVLHSMADGREYLYYERAEKLASDPTRTRKKILITGGSSALGDGVQDLDRRWWVLLEKKLRERLETDAIDVIPFAIRAENSSQDRLMLDFYVLPLKPDIVLNLSGANDISAVEFMVRPGDPFNTGILHARLDSFSFESLRWLSKHSALVEKFLIDAVFNDVQAAQNSIWKNPASMDRYGQSIVNIYADNIKQMARRCQMDSIPCYFFLQPLQFVTRTYTGLSEDERWEPFSRKAYDEIKSSLKKPFPAKTGFVDLSHLMDGHDDWYHDFVHLKEEAQELEAQRVADLLIEKKNEWWEPAPLKR